MIPLCTSKIFKSLNLFLVMFFLQSGLFLGQNFQLKIDSGLIKSYQIEIYGKTNQLFISENGFVDIPLENITSSDSLLILNLENNVSYNLFKDELKIQNHILNFSSGKTIEAVVINGKKKEFIIGIEDKGGSSRLYMLPNNSRMIEIPENKAYQNKKIKKIRYYFSGGKHPLSGERIHKIDTRIIAFMYTCESPDCKNPQYLLPKTEVNFSGTGKYLEIDVSHKNIVIDEDFKNIYVGFISLGNFVIKMKRSHKIGENKCYNVDEKFNWYKQATYHCPVIFLTIE